MHDLGWYNLMMGFIWFVNVPFVTNNLSLVFKPSCVHTQSPSNKNNIEFVFICHLWHLIHAITIVFVNIDANKTPSVHKSFLHICLKHWQEKLIKNMKYRIVRIKNTWIIWLIYITNWGLFTWYIEPNNGVQRLCHLYILKIGWGLTYNINLRAYLQYKQM